MDRELKGEVRELITGLLEMQKLIRAEGEASEECFDGLSGLRDSLESVRDDAENALNDLPEQKKYSTFGETLEEEISVMEDTMDLREEDGDISRDLLDILYEAAEMLNDISRPAG